MESAGKYASEFLNRCEWDKQIQNSNPRPICNHQTTQYDMYLAYKIRNFASTPPI